jgi:antitoxin component of MazEF toxin-antitoxin module
MIATLKTIKIGQSAGIVLSDEVLGKLNARIGDELEVVLTPRGIELRAKHR